MEVVARGLRRIFAGSALRSSQEPEIGKAKSRRHLLKGRFHRGFDEFYVGRSTYQKLTVQNRALIQSHRDETYRRFLIEGFVLRTVHKRVRRDYTLAAGSSPIRDHRRYSGGQQDARIEDVLATRRYCGKAGSQAHREYIRPNRV